MSTRILLFLLLGLPALAQVDTGIIAGTVKDSTGGILSGAAVVIRNNDTALERKVTTNQLGEYVSGPLPPAAYTVTGTMTGFRDAVATVVLALNQRAVLDFTLEIGAAEQKVTVTGGVSLLESETSTVDNVRTEQAVKDLPLNGRNFSELIGLTAGVMPAQTQVQSAAATAIRGTTANAVITPLIDKADDCAPYFAVVLVPGWVRS